MKADLNVISQESVNEINRLCRHKVLVFSGHEFVPVLCLPARMLGAMSPANFLKIDLREIEDATYGILHQLDVINNKTNLLRRPS